MNRRKFIASGIAASIVSAFDPLAFAASVRNLSGCRTLVLGGTAFALGYAQRHAGETVVLERGIHLAPEFSLTGATGMVGKPNLGCGCELVCEMSEAGLLSGDNLELPPLADFLNSYFSNRGVKVFLNAELVDLSHKNGKLQVLIAGGGGKGMVRGEFDAILDTTDIGWRDSGADLIIGKRFSAITQTGTFSIDLLPNSDWRNARLALYREWEASEHMSHDRVLAEAGAIQCLYRKGRIERISKEGFPWIPSSQFTSIIAAYEEGAEWTFR